MTVSPSPLYHSLPHSDDLPFTDLVPTIPDLKINRSIVGLVHEIPQRADRRGHHSIRLLVIIRIPCPEVDPTRKIVLVLPRGDETVAAEVDDGLDLHGCHTEGCFDRLPDGEARGGGDGEDDGDVGLRARRAPEDLVVGLAWGESVGRVDGSAPVEGSTAMRKGASVEKTAVGYCQASQC